MKHDLTFRSHSSKASYWKGKYSLPEKDKRNSLNSEEDANEENTWLPIGNERMNTVTES